MASRSPATSLRASARGIQHVDSTNSSETPTDVKKKKEKSKRPPNSNLRQQRLKAWQPILTAKTVLPLYFAVGLFFLPAGGLLFYASAKVREISIDYSNCARKAGDTFEDMPSSRVEKQFKHKSKDQVPAPQWRRELNTTVRYPDSLMSVSDTAKCFLRFTIEEDLKPPVLFYYRLSNFYQNHRNYISSFDALQLYGKTRTLKEIENSQCDRHLRDNGQGKPYYPCGLIANSIFNDTFLMPVHLNATGGGNSDWAVYNMTKRGISWPTEKNLYRKTLYSPEDVVPPPNWVRKWDYSKKMPDLSTDESFQVWMRTSALPMFSKLAMRNDDTVMKKGLYEIEIWDEFNTTLYNGTKSILISTRTAIGGRNTFLGTAYVVVGAFCLLLGIVLTAAHIFVRPRKLGDEKYLSWNKARPRKARITGKSPRLG